MAELYAIVGDMPRARFMLAGRVPYLQLRFKAAPLTPHLREIAAWPALFPRTRLIVNDDVAFAEAVSAWGVHLGQEDLRKHDPRALRGARVRLGISTHTDEEIAHALTFKPAMLGFGPVFPTTTKDVGHAPQGVPRLARMLRQVALPVVAIGGITPANLGAVVATGVAMVAMISALDGIASHDELRALMRALAP
ncbi:MAG: thiamine phosphate synthase [Candidatus Lambdaproteobacteria bacterium]|nr:thiamine phosphate synthase [Candidatus Lambdaproteobacteria bacterium]